MVAPVSAIESGGTVRAGAAEQRIDAQAAVERGCRHPPQPVVVAKPGQAVVAVIALQEIRQAGAGEIFDRRIAVSGRVAGEAAISERGPHAADDQP